jgi:hypothetical protein
MTNCRCDPFTGDECQACKNKMLVDKEEYERLKRLETAAKRLETAARTMYYSPHGSTEWDSAYNTLMEEIDAREDPKQ